MLSSHHLENLGLQLGYYMEEGAKEESVVAGCEDDPVANVGVALAEILHISNDLDKNASDIAVNSDLNAMSDLGDMLGTETKPKLSDTTSKNLPTSVSSIMIPSTCRMSQMSVTFDSAQSSGVEPILVSSMKVAGKGKEVAQRAKLRVSWASDVYDPPVTSVSHALKLHSPYHRHCRSSKQKDQHHKNKQKKTGHLHRSNGAMKNHIGYRKHSGRFDFKHHEQRVGAEVHIEMDFSDKSTAVEMMEYSVRISQESKCSSSSSIIRSSLENLQFSLAEA